MITYGIEIEYRKLRISFRGEIKPKDGQNVLRVITGNEILIFDGKIDNTNNGNDGLLEIVTPPKDKKDDSFFLILEKFISSIYEKAKSNKSEHLPFGYIALAEGQKINFYIGEREFCIEGVVGASIWLCPAVSIEEQTANPQITYGFGVPANNEENYLLYRLYAFFKPLDFYPIGWEMFNVTSFFNAKYYQPYNIDSENRFFAIFKESTETRNLWYIIEFIRLYLAFSLNTKAISAVNTMGYKGLMGFLARTSIRSMLAKSIENINDTNLIENKNNIIKYVNDTFNSIARNLMPFSNPILSYTYTPTYAVPKAMETAKNNLRYIDVYLKSIFEREPVTSQDLGVALMTGCDLSEEDVTGNLPLDLKKSTAVTVYKNIMTYDYFSPVPYSEPDDAMGFYSRYTTSKQPPRFLIEIRLLTRYLEKKYPDLVDKNGYLKWGKPFCIIMDELIQQSLNGWKD